jgi:hypothetical protein
MITKGPCYPAADVGGTHVWQHADPHVRLGVRFAYACFVLHSILHIPQILHIVAARFRLPPRPILANLVASLNQSPNKPSVHKVRILSWFAPSTRDSGLGPRD